MKFNSAEILADVDIVEILGDYLKLEPRGENYWGLCPFHPDKNPSLSVNQRLGIFHCFSSGCNVGGNAAKFISLLEGISYGRALGIIARKMGKSHLAPEVVEDAKDIFEINEIVGNLYTQVLFSSPKFSKRAREFLRDRHITQETARLFGLGYSPNSWTWLTNQGLNRKLLLKSRLIKATEAGHFRDFFKNRIIFPIYHQKRLVGFTGRTLGTASKIPKYMNSGESDWYKKREVIYGWHINGNNIRRSKQVVIVEGQFDLLQLYQRGITNSIAISGSHFGVKQAAFIKQNVREAIIFCDGDSAGAKVGIKLGGRLLEQGVQVQILFIDGKDPDDLARYKHRFNWSDLQERLVSPVKFAFEHDGLEAGLTIASLHKNKIKLGYALRELSELSGYEERHLEHWLDEYKKSPMGSGPIKPRDTHLQLKEELLLLAAFKQESIPVSKYLRLKLRRDGVNLGVAKTAGFIQELAEESKFVTRLHLLAKVTDIEKYTDDLKAHLTLEYLGKDVKRLKRKLKEHEDITYLGQLESTVKRINKIKLRLKTGKDYQSHS